MGIKYISVIDQPVPKVEIDLINETYTSILIDIVML